MTPKTISSKINIRRLRALIKKESYQIIRDPSTLLISIVLPAILLFLYAYGVSLDLNHLRIGLVMEDTSPDAQELAESFTNSRYFDVKIVRDRRELLHDITKGTIRGYVVIPSYFSELNNMKGMEAPLQVIADGSEVNTSNLLQNYVQGAYENWLSQRSLTTDKKTRPQITIEPRVWFNQQLESKYFLLPGSLAIIITLIGTLLTALVVSREWERGTMEGLISTPVNIQEIVIGKVLPYFILGMISLAICVALSVLVFGIPFRGSYLLLALVSASFLVAALGLGFMISTLSKNQLPSYQIATVAGFLPAFILSGFLFEIYSMPFWIQILTYIIPARYFVQSLLTLFLVGDVTTLIFFNMLPMIAIGLVFFVISAFKTSKKLE